MRSKGDIDIGVGRQGVRRRRPQERGRLHGHRPDRRAAEDVHREDRGHRCSGSDDLNHGRPARRRQAGRPDLARRRRARAARARRAAHRPHRHARSGRDRRAAARGRPRDAARAVPERRRQDVRGRRPPGCRDRHVRWRRDAGSGPSHQGALPSREAIDRALDAFRGTFLQQPPAYSAKKIDGTPQLQAGAARAARIGASRHPDRSRHSAPRLPFQPPSA